MELLFTCILLILYSTYFYFFKFRMRTKVAVLSAIDGGHILVEVGRSDLVHESQLITKGLVMSLENNTKTDSLLNFSF